MCEIEANGKRETEKQRHKEAKERQAVGARCGGPEIQRSKR